MKDFFDITKLDQLSHSIEESTFSTPRTLVYKAAFAHKLAVCQSISRKMIFVTTDEKIAKTQDQLTQMGVKVVTLDPIYDVVMHRVAVNMSVVGKRIQSLMRIVEGDYDILLVTPKVITQYFPDKALLKAGIFTIKEGEEIDSQLISDQLTMMGYKRRPRAEEKGEFAVFGEVVEIFQPSSELPLRIVLDYDTVLSMKYFSLDTMQGNARVDSVTLAPISDLLADVTVDEICARMTIYGAQNAKAAVRTQEIINDLTIKLSSGGLNSSMIWLIPFIKDKLSTIFDYLPQDALIVLDEPSVLFDLMNAQAKAHAARVKELIKSGEALKEHYSSIISVEQIMNEFNDFSRLGFSDVSSGLVDVGKGFFVVDSLPLPDYFKDTVMMVKDLSEYAERGYQIRLYCGSDDNVELMKSYLGDLKVEYSAQKLNRGFSSSLMKLMLIGTQDLYLSTIQKTTKTKIKRHSIAPKVGDYVVHDKYGVGKCLGVVRQKNYVGENDYLLIEYAKGNKVYVPVRQMDRLELYMGAETNPKLSDINKDEFTKQKEKARTSIKKLAFDLLELYAKRENSKGYKYPLDSPLQVEFERSFEFTETPDQLQAVEDIKADMQAGKVMDRLICGDVGFGKTEVALRAIFKTVCENKQVAFMAPTTILSEQHFMTVSTRLAPFGITVACLNRFRTAAQAADIISRLKAGTLSVVVGTHRLLSKDIEFFDLGLLVLDEEQRFGVEHKEKIKTLRNNINVLSMSATPIPRTLYMALSGIRDVSLLDTPPKGRKAVDTVVCEYSDALLFDAVNAELERGGQVFVMYNSVEKIYYFAERLSELFPDASIVVGHGQMGTKELEAGIFKFYNREAQILLATTIIENGIDVPNANTLFVVEANKLGLSQMYQLKGRVGRSTRLAHAIFTYPQNYVPTGDVAKRLSALADATELGSGYRLAVMDMEIRGAGNILGAEQHGHAERIGYDMYSKLLRETISLLQGEAVTPYTFTEVSVIIDAYVPEDVVPSERERLNIYKRIAEFENVEQMKEFKKDFEEMYGVLPMTVANLASVSMIRVLGSTLGAQVIKIGDKYTEIKFVSEDYLKSAALSKALIAVGRMCTYDKYDRTLRLWIKKVAVWDKMEFLIKFLNYINGNYDN